MNYDDFIEHILITRGRHGCQDYFETHHIIPRCMGGSNDDNNLVDLTGQEHFIAHKLLYEKYPHNKELAYAWHILCYHKSTQNRYEPTPEEVAAAREAAANAWRGQHHTVEAKNKIRQKLTGIKRSEETKQKLRDTNLGKHHTEETKKKQSASHNPQKYLNLDTGFIGSCRDISIKYNCGIRTIASAFERHSHQEVVQSIGYSWKKMEE